jgi:hypothetical protein
LDAPKSIRETEKTLKTPKKTKKKQKKPLGWVFFLKTWVFSNPDLKTVYIILFSGSYPS